MSIDVETVAAELYRSAGIEPAELPGVTALAVRLLGPGAIQERTALQRRAKLVRAARQIWIQPQLTPEQRTFSIAHELAEWHLDHVSGSIPDREVLCDAIAAALVVPRDALLHAIRNVGRDLERLARHFVTTQSTVALRIGEVTGQPVALVTPQRIVVRGDPWPWPEAQQLRDIARGDEHPALRRTRLTDERRRVTLEVRDAA